MVILSNYAINVLFRTVRHNLSPHQGYDAPPIYYWFRNVIEAIKLVDNGNEAKEGNYNQSLENKLGIVSYSVRYANSKVIYIITDFKFNGSTIRQYKNRVKLSRRGVDLSSRSLYTSPSYKPTESVNIGYGIICDKYENGKIWLSYKGTSLETQFDKMLKKFCKWRDGMYAIFEKDGIRYKLFPNRTVQMMKEERQRTIRLTETQFKQMLVECITKIIKEIA
ncbi:MAG: hypothetical protein HDS49_02890 [Bacteroides sp.]|nr:hypothetical protein [Bacteroides sp.]